MSGYTRPKSTLAALVSLWTLASVTLGGCGGTASQTSNTPSLASSSGETQSAQTSASNDATSHTSKSSSPSKNGDADSGFGWAPFGPSDPGDPPPNRWYVKLEDHDCAGMSSALEQEPGGDLWRALDAVCKAAIEGDQSKWAVAKTAAQAIESSQGEGSTGCLADAAKALLIRALAWHRDHPGQQPVVRLPKPGQKTACPFRVTSVVRVDSSGNPLPGPLEGPLAGGTLLAIRGHGLTNHPTVSVGGHPATLSDSTFVDGAIVVVSPPVSHPFVGKIRVSNKAGQVVAPVTFTYVIGGPLPRSGSPAPSASGSP